MTIPLRVLIVEDSEDDASLLLRLLGRGGYDPASERVETPEAMRQALDRASWDVVLSDYAMPHFSAAAALDMVKSRQLDLPFIIVSGAIGEDTAVAMMKAGAHDYVRKDNPARLVAAIERELREASERRKRRIAEDQVHRYEGRLRSMASELSLAEERQRRILATDLHDGIGQYLVLAQIKLGGLQKLADSTPMSAQLAEVRDLIDQAIRDARTLTTQLSPPILYDLGLEAGLKWLCEQIQGQQDLHVRFHGESGSMPIDTDLRVVLFQSVRELLRNVMRHAQARTADVTMRTGNGSLLVIVEDDGAGFDPATIDAHLYKAGSFGLFSVRERLKSLGGELTIESQPGKGTRVMLAVALESP